MQGDVLPVDGGQDEVQVGGTSIARRVNAGLRSLARAARSFLLYDPSNAAIRGFLEQYNEEMVAAVTEGSHAAGASGLSLLVRPFELVWQDEVVYVERDRERSLAFRMFRDGVRRLTIGRDVTWDELLRLLQILSVRFTGLRQQEEDIVTLLWKAGFKHIEIVAVEGFTPEDEAEGGDETEETVAGQAEGGSPSSVGGGARLVDAPYDFDLPIPTPLNEARLVPATVSAEDLELIRHEATSLTLPRDCLRLATELVALVQDPTDPTTWSDIKPLVEEVRDFLLSDGQLGSLVELLGAMSSLRSGGDRDVQGVLDGFIDGRAMRRIIHSIPASATAVPDELIWMVTHLPGDHLTHALEVLAVERAAASRRVARQLIEHLAQLDPPAVLARIERDAPEVAADLLRAFAEALPDRAQEAIERAVFRGEMELALEALRVLSDRVDAAETSELLIRLLDSPLAEVRMRSLAMLTAHPKASMFDPLVEALLRRSHGEMGPDEARAFGELLAVVSPVRAASTLSEWIRPASIWKRMFAVPVGNRWQQWAAVSGLARLPGAEPEAVIQWLAERAGEDLAQHCTRSLVRRRRELPRG